MARTRLSDPVIHRSLLFEVLNPYTTGIYIKLLASCCFSTADISWLLVELIRPLGNRLESNGPQLQYVVHLGILADLANAKSVDWRLI